MLPKNCKKREGLLNTVCSWTTHSASQAEQFRDKSHLVLKWKNPRNNGNMSIHENFKDAVKSRATTVHQGQGYTYTPPHERKGQQFFTSKIPTEVHSLATTLSTPRRVPAMESHPWNTGAVVIVIVIVNDMVEFATLGRFSTVARGATRRVARSAMVGEMVAACWTANGCITCSWFMGCDDRSVTFIEQYQNNNKLVEEFL